MCSLLISSDHDTEEMRDILIRNILFSLYEGSTYESRYLSFLADGTNARHIVSFVLELHLKNVSMRTIYWTKCESSSGIWIWLTFDICVIFNSEWNKRERKSHRSQAKAKASHWRNYCKMVWLCSSWHTPYSKKRCRIFQKVTQIKMRVHFSPQRPQSSTLCVKPCGYSHPFSKTRLRLLSLKFQDWRTEEKPWDLIWIFPCLPQLSPYNWF